VASRRGGRRRGRPRPTGTTPVTRRTARTWKMTPAASSRSWPTRPKDPPRYPRRSREGHEQRPSFRWRPPGGRVRRGREGSGGRGRRGPSRRQGTVQGPLRAGGRGPPAPEPLPKKVRPGIRQIAAVLALSPSLAELLKLSEILDFRDLKEGEIAYLEEVHIQTIRRWRTEGMGPEYRNHGSIRYPVRFYWEW
jgi:hypothetical protein